MNGRSGFYVSLSAITMALFISVVIHDPVTTPNFYSDILGSVWPRGWVQSGAVPYLREPFEYPVISGLIVYLVRAVGHDLASFYSTFSALSLAAGGVVAWSCWSIAKKLGKNLNPVYFVMPSFILYGIYNFDLFHVMFVLLGIQSYLAKRKGLSAGFLGLAVDTKLTSIVLLPVFLIELRTNRERFSYLVSFAAVVAAFNLPFALANPSNFLQGYQFVSGYGLENAWYVWIFQNPATWTYAKYFGIGVSGLILLRVYTMKTSLVAKVFLALAAYLLGTYIYSPQFNVLLLPILALVDFQHPSLYLWDGFNALIILTWFITPTLFVVGGCPPNQTWCPTIAGSWVQFFALLRAGSLAWIGTRIAKSEGHDIIGSLRRILKRPSKVTPVPTGLSLP